VCGYEKSGTTLLNEILRRHPELDSGFEGGFLLGDSPRDFHRFQPYYTFFRQTWELSRDEVKYICDCDDFGECYRRARQCSPVIANKNSLVFDKTPIYMKHLPEVLSRVPGVPCVVCVRDPRALMVSWARWSGAGEGVEQWVEENFAGNVERYVSYADGFRRALKGDAGRLLLVRFELLCTEVLETLTTVFGFLGLEFREEFLRFSSKHFVYGNTVSTDYLFPYRDAMSSDLCDRILDATRDYADWHYHG
jgi:hypothetical protein